MPASSNRQIFSKQQLKDFVTALRSIFSVITKEKKKSTTAAYLKYPQVSGIFTESIALHLLRERKILKELKGYTFAFGGREADVVGEKGRQKKKIEIKGTGKQGFQYFGSSDINADFLIWIHYDNFFLNSKEDSFEVYVIKKPLRYYSHSGKVVLKDVLFRAADVQTHTFSMDSILKLSK